MKGRIPIKKTGIFFSPPFGKACLPVGRGGGEGFYKSFSKNFRDPLATASE